MNPGIKMKKEEGIDIEMTISVNTLQEHGTRDQELSQCIRESISQEDPKKINDEIRMLTDIQESKETISFYIKDEESENIDMTINDITMDLFHINDKTNYTKFINQVGELQDKKLVI